MHQPQAQEDVWGGNPEATAASSFPTQGGTGRYVDGGLVLDGIWSFASGIDFVDWENLQCFIPNEKGLEKDAPEVTGVAKKIDAKDEVETIRAILDFAKANFRYSAHKGDLGAVGMLQSKVGYAIAQCVVLIHSCQPLPYLSIKELSFITAH